MGPGRHAAMVCAIGGGCAMHAASGHDDACRTEDDVMLHQCMMMHVVLRG